MLKQSALVLVLTLLILVPLPVLAVGQVPRVDPRVLQDTLNGGSADMLVLLKAEPDLHRMQSRNRVERGRRVVAALQQTAHAAQTPVLALLDNLGVAYRTYWVADLIAVHGDRATLDALARRSDIVAVESNRVFKVPLEEPQARTAAAPTTTGWGTQQINAPGLWEMGLHGEGIVYANADTGVQWDHPAIQEQYRGWNGTSADHNYNWWDALHSNIGGSGNNPCTPDGFAPAPASGSTVPCDDYGHGTHTLGIGVGDDAGENQIGVAPGAKWMACRNMDRGVGRPETYIECMQFFLAPTDLQGDNPDPDKRPDVVGNSYACPPDELCAPESLTAAMESMRAAGIFMAVSAGNEGPSCGTVQYPPGSTDAAITVGSTDTSDTIAGSSSRGPVTVDESGRRKPDLAAPGVGIRSSYPTDTYVFMSGTSMAAPQVAGAVALLWSAYPDLRGNVGATEALLEQSAHHLTTNQGCGGDISTTVPNNVYGYGRIDVLAAYDFQQLIDAPFKYYFPFIPHEY